MKKPIKVLREHTEHLAQGGMLVMEGIPCVDNNEPLFFGLTKGGIYTAVRLPGSLMVKEEIRTFTGFPKIHLSTS